MQALLASLVVGLTVKDAAFTSGMAAARADAKRTGQDVERSTSKMADAVERAAHGINAAVVRIGESATELGERVTRAGLALTAGLTVPLGLVGKSAKDTAADFETGMNKVRAAMLSADPRQIAQLRTEALKLGPTFGRSATETAGAIESLAKNGLGASEILGGALVSSMRLAIVGQAELGESADVTTDIMAQFGKTADQLPEVVDRVSGALDASKLNFDDYRLAIGQAGGVAGGIGVDFEQFNAAIAATTPLFASGSDAGTSFKTFLTSLNPKSKEAAGYMEELGLSFYDAQGAMKPLPAIAEELRQKIGALQPDDRTKALDAIFGVDGMRTAIALITQGSAGLERMERAIASVRAQDKIDILQEGDVAATQRLASAAEALKIRFGEVLLPIFIAVKNGLASLMTLVSNAPQGLINMAIAVGVVAAAIGPLILALKVAAIPALALWLTRLGGVSAALGAIVNPLGFFIRLLGQAAAQAGAASVLGLIGTRLVALAGPIGIVISLLLVLWPLLNRTAVASKAHAVALDAARKAEDEAAKSAQKLATATGALREELLKKAKADQAAAVAALKKAYADNVAAKEAAQRARIEQAAAVQRARFDTRGAGGGRDSIMAAINAGDQSIAAATENWRSTIAALESRTNALATVTASIRIAEAAPSGTASVEGEADEEKKGKGASSGTDPAQAAAQYQDELGRLRIAELQAQADLTGAVEARYRADIEALAEERASFKRQLQLDEDLTDTQRATLMAAKDRELTLRAQNAEQERARGLARQAFDIESEINAARQEAVRAEVDLADSAAARRDGQLRLLDLQKEQERRELELALATEDTASAAYEIARRRRAQLDADYARRAEGVRRDTESPIERYGRELGRSAAAIDENVQEELVDTFDRLGDEIAETGSGLLKLGGIAGRVFNDMLTGLYRLAIQQAVLKPLFGAIMGGLGGGVTTSVSALSSAANSALDGLSFGGGKASGGRVGPGNWYMVGEQGPEPFIPDRAGTILPNKALRGGGDTKIYQTIQFSGGVDLATREEVYRVAEAARTAAIAGVREQDRRRG